MRGGRRPTWQSPTIRTKRTVHFLRRSEATRQSPPLPLSLPILPRQSTILHLLCKTNPILPIAQLLQLLLAKRFTEMPCPIRRKKTNPIKPKFMPWPAPWGVFIPWPSPLGFTSHQYRPNRSASSTILTSLSGRTRGATLQADDITRITRDSHLLKLKNPAIRCASSD